MSPRPECAVSPGFVLLAAWFAWSCGWEMLAAVMLAAVIHELGHFLVLCCFGIRVRSLRVCVLGAVMEADTARLSYPRELVATLAGPGANLLFCALLSIWDESRFTPLVGASVVLCVFNLLPILPLDGGRALYLLTAWCFGGQVGERVARVTGACCAVALGGGLFYVMACTGGSLWLAPVALAAFAAAARLLLNYEIFW